MSDICMYNEFIIRIIKGVLRFFPQTLLAFPFMSLLRIQKPGLVVVERCVCCFVEISDIEKRNLQLLFIYT